MTIMTIHDAYHLIAKISKDSGLHNHAADMIAAWPEYDKKRLEAIERMKKEQLREWAEMGVTNEHTDAEN